MGYASTSIRRTGGTMSDFVHLHTHTDNSSLDGMTPVEAVVAAAASDGQGAVAVTDHGSLGGALLLARTAEKVGLKAIGGQEMYLATGTSDRFDRKKRVVSVDESEGTKSKAHHHLTVLAGSAVGWTNMIEINNKAMHSLVSDKPRADMALLREHGEGLILGTGCLGGPVAYELMNGDPDTRLERAKDATERLLEVVDGDKDRLFVEIMDHKIPAEQAILSGLSEISSHFGLRMVATNDAHFPREENFVDHDVLLAIGTKKKLSDPKRFRFKGDGGYWMKTEQEMRRVFPDLINGQDVISNSGVIASMVSGNLIDFMPAPRIRLPKFPVPPQFVREFDEGAPGAASCQNAGQYYLYCKVREGARSRYPIMNETIAARLRFEMDVIQSFSFEDYFLIVSALTDKFHDDGEVLGAGRGSAAGSLVAYCLRVTDVDPLVHNLLFERFLDVFRKGYPDVDLDFSKAGEAKVMPYFREMYGGAHVARIGTNSTKKAKAILDDVGRVNDQPTDAIKIKSALPGVNSNNLKIREYVLPENMPSSTENEVKRKEAARVEGAGLRDLLNAAGSQGLLNIARQASRLENVRGGVGIHACGIIVSDEPLTGLVPMRLDKKTGDMVTMWTAPEMESLGFIKMDALTINNLDVVERSRESIFAATGEMVQTAYGRLPMDPATNERSRKAFDLICRGDTSGLFQIEGGGITKVAMDVAPRSLDDLSAVVALYRPGPMGAGMPARFAARKNGREEATYDYLSNVPAEHVALDSVLAKSYGVIVVQEDLMNLSRAVAGFGPGRRNRLRQAFSKKKQDEMAALKEDFMSGGMMATTESAEADWVESIPFTRATLENLWTTFEASAAYLFNASHSAPYAYLAYIQAYLKANWPAHFGSALLSVKEDIADRISVMHSIRRSGVQILGPDINESGIDTMAVGDTAIRLGLCEIRGVRTNANSIVAEREANGPFADLKDVVRRIEGEVERKKNIKDEDGQIVETTISTSVQKLSMSVIETLIDSGCCDSFGHPRRGMSVAARAMRFADDVTIPETEYGPMERSFRERSGLGIVVSQHPIAMISEQAIQDEYSMQPVKISRLEPSLGVAPIEAVVASVLTKRGTNGKMRAHLVLEDDTAATDAVMWSNGLDTFETTYGRYPQEGDIVRVSARIKTMIVRVENNDSTDPTDDEEAIPDERMDVIVNSMSMMVRLGDEQAQDVQHTVRTPLRMVKYQDPEPEETSEPAMLPLPAPASPVAMDVVQQQHDVHVRVHVHTPDPDPDVVQQQAPAITVVQDAVADVGARIIRISLRAWLIPTQAFEELRAHGGLDSETVDSIVREIRKDKSKKTVSVAGITITSGDEQTRRRSA